MAKRTFGPHSRCYDPPAPDGSIAPGAFGIPGITALTCTTETAIHNQTTVLVDRVAALYDPDRSLLPPEIGPGARLIGFVKEELRPRRRWGRPQLLTLYRPLFELPQEDGPATYMAPWPDGFDLESGIHEELAAELAADLPFFSIDALARRSFVTRDQIVAIAEAQAAAQWDAMARDGFKPSCLALDSVFLSKKIGDKRKALHVAAVDPASGIYCTLALIAFGADEQEPVIERLAEIFRRLPHPEALLATATDGGPERGLVAEALERARGERPELAPTPVLDPFHLIGSFVGVLAERRIALQQRWKNDRSKKRREAAELMKNMARVIVKMRWSRIERCEETREKMETLFALSQELEESYFIVDGLRQVFDCRSRETADRAYAAWRRELAKVKTRSFDKKANSFDDKWEKVRRIFEVCERSDAIYDHLLSYGTNPVESLNKRAKEVWTGARNSNLRLIELRLIAGQGYKAKALALSEPTLVRRKRKHQELHPRKVRAARRRNKRLGGAPDRPKTAPAGPHAPDSSAPPRPAPATDPQHSGPAAPDSPSPPPAGSR